MDEGLIKHFLENQGKQLELQVHESKLREKQLEQTHEIAKESLKYQNLDQQRHADNKLKSQRQQLLFWGGIVFLFMVLIGLTICLNKENIALEILKVVVPAILSAVGSYFYGLHKGAQKEKEYKYSPYEEIELED